MKNEVLVPYSRLLKEIEKQKARKHGRELAERKITGRRKPREIPEGKLIRVDFRNEQEV